MVVTDGVAVIRMDNSPVNVLTHEVRCAVSKHLAAAGANGDCRGIVLRGTEKFFVSGADIKEFDTGLRSPTPTSLADQIESMEKPVVAAISGSALGVGLELAIACHYRICTCAAQLGLPEITLGVVPGAGGTHRLPRLVGVKAALKLMLTGKPIGASQAMELGLVDEITDTALEARATAVAQACPIRRTGSLRISGDIDSLIAESLRESEKLLRNRTTPALLARAVRASAFPHAEGVEDEERIVLESFNQEESRALRHLFFAERNTSNVPGMTASAPQVIARVTIVGSGTMGGGIAMCFADAGISVTVIDVDSDSLANGLARVKANYEASVKRGSLTAQEAGTRQSLVLGSTNYSDAADADLIIEAVPEKMDLKREVFGKLDRIAKAGAILATNTSTLDINQIARATARPHDVIGLHFFSPANVMRLLEIVRTDSTSSEAITTAFALARRIRKTGVLSNVCYGFIGNRMMDPYAREAERAVLEGASPAQVDGALEEFGMAMGILAVFDLAGIDVTILTRLPSSDPTYFRCSTLLYQHGWLGQKTGLGYYRYEGRNRKPHPEAEEVIRQEARRLNVERRVPSATEILERCLYGLVNEGAKILEEGVALRAADVDVVYTSGYGFPRYRGGPMFWADSVGLERVVSGIKKLADRFGTEYWTPAPLLTELARTHRRLSDWSRPR
jgi:3-hydroxyacyl-CoA dehydrogenase